MKREFRVATMSLLLLSAFRISAQVCGCNINQVLSNSVNPCTITKGRIVTVSTNQELQDAIRHANGTHHGFTILLHDGHYDVSYWKLRFNINTNHVVVRSLSGHRDKVILEGSGMRDISPQIENGITVNGSDVIIADLTIKNVANHGIQIQNHRVTVHNVRIEDCYQQLIKGSSFNPQIDSSVIQCSWFEYTAGIGPNYYIGGIDAHAAKDWQVRDNFFKNIASPADFVAEHAIHFWNNSSGTLVERNIIVNCDRGIGFGLGNSFHYGGIIRNNMIYNSGDTPFNDTGIGLESAPGARVYNNTIFIRYPNAIEYRFTQSTGIEIANNLCNRSIKRRDDAHAVLQQNYTEARIEWFTDPQSGLLLLSDAIPEVIDMGIDLYNFVQDDILQNARPLPNSGIQFDIGAHEFRKPNSADNGQMPGAFEIHHSATEHYAMVRYYDILGQPISEPIKIGHQDFMEAQLPFKGLAVAIYFDNNHRPLWGKKFLKIK